MQIHHSNTSKDGSTQPFSISFRLEGAGWASLVLAFEDRSFEIGWVSDLTDVLGDMVRAALSMVTGAEFLEIVLDTEDEPEFWGMLLRRNSDVDPAEPLVTLSVCRGTWSTEAMHVIWDRSETVFEADLTRRCFAQEVESVARTVAKGDGIAKYRELWPSHEFPSKALATLRYALLSE